MKLNTLIYLYVYNILDTLLKQKMNVSINTKTYYN